MNPSKFVILKSAGSGKNTASHLQYDHLVTNSAKGNQRTYAIVGSVTPPALDAY